jgi:hypothetical protein
MSGYNLNSSLTAATWNTYWKRFNETTGQFYNRAAAIGWNATAGTRPSTNLTDPAPPVLGTPWGPKTGEGYGGGRQDGYSFNEYPFERYDIYANYDAVVFGVAD